VISGRRDPDVWPISCCPAVKERARQRAATGSAFGRSTEGAESSRHRQLLPSQKTVGCSPEKNRRCPKSQMGKGEEAESQLERTRIGEALSATPGSLKKRHHSKSRVSHHTVHLSVMDGAVGMTASQSQASAKRIPLSGACGPRTLATCAASMVLCFTPNVPFLSTCGLGQCYAALPRMRGTSQQSFFRFDSVRFSVQGSNLMVVPGRLGKVGGTTDDMQCCSLPSSQV